MTDGDSISQLAVVVLLLVLAVPALATAYDYAGTPFEYEDSTTIDQGNQYNVSENATDTEGYSETVTVVANNTTLTAGSDYTWNASAGRLTWDGSTAEPQGTEATITYDAYQRTPETAMSWSLIAPFMALFGLYALVASVRVLWSYTAEVWDL